MNRWILIFAALAALASAADSGSEYRPVEMNVFRDIRQIYR